MSSNDNNLIVSPFSVSNALAMVLYGARGNTWLEMRKVIFGNEIWDNQHKSLDEQFNDLFKLFNFLIAILEFITISFAMNLTLE